jgi:hypothetical protein
MKPDEVASVLAVSWGRVKMAKSKREAEQKANS